MKKDWRRSSFCLLTVVFLSFFFYANKGTAEGKDLTPIKTDQKTPNTKADEDLEIIRARIIEDLLQPAVPVAKVEQLISTIKPDGSWPGINYKDTTKTGFEHRIHLENMLDLARAYRKTGSEFKNNADVKNTLSSALDFWIVHDFICENWWWNEMGTPNWMINTLLVMDPDLTKKQKIEGAKIAGRASLTGVGARAGGDFVPIAGMVCKQGLFQKDEAILSNALKVMADQIVLTPSRGINPDMGFHHRTDNVTSIHTYGTNYVSSFSYWMVKTAGTKYALPAKALTLLVDYYVDGISKSMAYGIYPDPAARNRDLSRRGEGGHAAGTEIPENLLLSTDYRKNDLEYLIKVRKRLTTPDLTWNKYFWHSSYFAHQRKNYYTSVRMYSTRQFNMEVPHNEEGLKMHHVADGGNFLSRTGKEYVDLFPVWDWQKIPGTTVVQKPSLPPFKEIAKKGKTDFVGAVSDGQFGAAAFDFKSVHDPLSARKSWFFFDGEYVGLGAGINAEAEYDVATTLNQCLLNGGVVVKSGAGTKTLEKGQHQLKNVSWVVHDSVAYLFPVAANVNIGNTTAMGSWRDINHQASAPVEPVKKDLFSLWFNHGRKPMAARYAYMVVPGINATTANGYLAKSGVVILSNNPNLQAVQNRVLNTTEAVFYKPGTIKINSNLSLTAESPCIVLVKMGTNSIERIAVSDPTAKLATLQLKVTTPIENSGKNWRSTWNSQSKVSTIVIDLPTEGYAGQSAVLEFAARRP
ncbi:polysaccharide lyase family 8 super-sandwich domain-containing protein [Segetibacter sp.]|jgi:chondroitin AC lyase|uniref:polysaccharide lyase family 8 super-sandwich domain-containing protein n=1 Tax=Segetibacter sp. TaxID=2231182 RepID=UPI0026256548|nr:polysaccharide lyase family 8 super-sandwich domain-containing protein [Segetibacter sp.]MCW3080169.1 chondroitin lyase [Segetibacter sp.]